MLVKNGDHKARLIGYKAGTYLVVTIKAHKDEYNKGGELVCKSGDIWSYHLQYPTRQEVYDHLQYLKHANYDLISIKPSAETNQSKFALPIYNPARFRNCGYNVKSLMSKLSQ